MLNRLRVQLPAIFTVLGVLSLVGAVGLYLIYAQANRWVITAGAIGVVFLVYAVLERPETVRASVTSREARYGGNTVLLTGAFVGIVALANILSARHSFRWDLTETKDFSLSAQTVQVVEQIAQPVKITAFYQQGQSGQQDMQDLLKEYSRYSDKLTYEFVDPVLKPGVARDMRIETYPTTVLEGDGRRQTVSSASEGEITSALLKLQRGEPKKVGWITGHGELDTEATDPRGASEAKRLVELENYKIQPLTLLATTEVPADIGLVVLAGPRQPLLPQEADVLQKYLDRGGKLLVMADPRSPGNPTDMLAKWGVEVGTGIVLDFAQNVQNDPLTPAIVKYEPNPVMKNVSGDATGRYITIFPGAEMVRAKPGNTDTALQVQTIAQSSANSWLESDERIDLRTVKLDEGKDIKGPVPIAVSVLKGAPPSTPIGADQSKTPPSTRIVAIGNSTFASNNLLSVIQVPGNRDLLLNAVNWLAEDEQLLGVRAKVNKDRTLILTGTQQNLLLYSSTLFLPLAVMAVGAYVWWTRR